MSALPKAPAAPTPPNRATMGSTAFSTAADAFAAFIVAFATFIDAWSDAVPELVSPANFNTVSSSSVAVGTGAKSFTVDTNKLLYATQWLLIASTSSPTNYMVGQVTSYNSSTGALVVSVLYASGSGTIASWTIGPVAAPNTAVNPRAVTAATSGTITPDAATSELVIVNGATGSLTFAAPSGSPVEGQKMMLRFKDNGTSRSLTWNAIYRAFGTVALPSATTVGKWHYVGLIYNAVDSKWDVVSHAIQQ